MDECVGLDAVFQSDRNGLIVSYQLLKIIHILSATIMIGTGLGSAFYLFLTYKRGGINTITDVVKLVVLADTIFTFPSVVIQLVTGVMLSNMLGFTYSRWFWVVIGVSFLVLVTWLKAVVIQLRLKKILKEKGELTQEYHRLMSLWFYLGVPSFLASMFLYYLMIYKPFM